MNNPFDNKIKESLENFEMPYDANAWAQLEKELPQSGGASVPAGSQFGWKAAALVAVVATGIATVLYLNQPDDTTVVEVPAVHDTVTDQAETHPSAELPKASESTSEKQAESRVSSNVKTPEVAGPEADETMGPSQTDDTAPENTTTDGVSGEPSMAEAKPDSKPNVSPIRITPMKTESKTLVVNFLPSSVNVCAGADVSFINESSDMKADMTWDFGDGTTSKELNPVHTYVLPGTYTVTLVGAKNSENVDHTANITGNQSPTPMFSSARKLEGYVAIPLYHFSTGTLPTETAVWSFSDGTAIVGTKVDHLFREAGTATAQLTVTNNFGCSSTMEETYEVADFNLLAPNTFSPNGDGINDNFIPRALTEMGIAFEMTIQNPRTGELIYRTENPADPWNGTMNNAGNKLENGIYIWTVVLKENVVKNKIFNGKINLQQ